MLRIWYIMFSSSIQLTGMVDIWVNFRLENYIYIVICSDKLKHSMLSNTIIGFDILPINIYHIGLWLFQTKQKFEQTICLLKPLSTWNYVLFSMSQNIQILKCCISLLPVVSYDPSSKNSYCRRRVKGHFQRGNIRQYECNAG